MSVGAGDNFKEAVGRWELIKHMEPEVGVAVRSAQRARKAGTSRGTVVVMSIKDTSHLVRRANPEPAWWVHQCTRLDITLTIPVNLGCNYCGRIKP